MFYNFYSKNIILLFYVLRFDWAFLSKSIIVILLINIAYFVEKMIFLFIKNMFPKNCMQLKNIKI